jgi:hypothetical protein
MIPTELLRIIHLYSSIDTRKRIESAVHWDPLPHTLIIPLMLKYFQFKPNKVTVYDVSFISIPNTYHNLIWLH